MKFKIKGDDRPLLISSYEGLVHYLNGTSQTPSKNIEDFMINYAERALEYKNLEIATSDVESFVEDLMESGEVVRLD